MITGLCVSIESMALDIQDYAKNETKWARRYNKVLLQLKEEKVADATAKKKKAYLLRERKKKTEEELMREEEEMRKRAATAAKLKEALLKNKSVVSGKKSEAKALDTTNTSTPSDGDEFCDDRRARAR